VDAGIALTSLIGPSVAESLQVANDRALR